MTTFLYAEMAEFCTNSNASLNSTPYSLKDDIEQSSVSKKRKRMRFNSNKEVSIIFLIFAFN